MNFYRCYFLSASDAIKNFAEFSSRDDNAALDHARNLLKTQFGFYGFELWQGARRIHRETIDSGDAIKTHK
ncbi:MAG TPA: hypothetical protein VG328_04140 [Stellaceae bacterium]|jgi:hypothetical protein|nr:hypothetical protein [Stellaceae bacterium]